MDAALPWSTKVGGIATESDLYLGGDALDGGVVGLALHGTALEAVVGQGATPVGPAFKVTACEGNVVRSLDGSDVGAALDPVLADWNPMMGDLKIGVSVPTRPAADGGPAPADAPDAYVVRQLLGMNREASALAIGAAPDLLAAEDVAIQLHAFGPQAAKRELEDAAARLKGGAGGLLVPCVGRGPALYGEADVESRALAAALGRELELAGFFANGEIGPVGARTFVHTFSTVVGLLR
jgi:small ligand-binding sensory domain FIST